MLAPRSDRVGASQAGCAIRSPGAPRATDSPNHGGPGRRSTGARSPRPPATSAYSRHETAAEAPAGRPATHIASPPPEQGALGRTQTGRPGITGWAASPTYSLAAPATCPVVPRARIRRCRFARRVSHDQPPGGGYMRSIALDVHRDFCEVAIKEGDEVRSARRLKTSVEELERFARSLAPDDQVALEATGPANAIARILEPHVARVVVANTRRVRAIAEAKVKTDKVDAATLCELLAAGFLPAVWSPDESTRALRGLLGRRDRLVRSRTS